MQILSHGRHHNSRPADHISFSVAKGELCVVVGPSGAGKTTLLNMLGGMDNCDEGEIYLDGAEISSYGNESLPTTGAMM